MLITSPSQGDDLSLHQLVENWVMAEVAPKGWAWRRHGTRPASSGESLIDGGFIRVTIATIALDMFRLDSISGSWMILLMDHG